VFWFSLQLLRETFFILRTERDMTKNVYRSSCKVPIILVRFKWHIFSRQIFDKYTKYQNFMKIRPVGAELFHADGRTCSCFYAILLTRLKMPLHPLQWLKCPFFWKLKTSIDEPVTFTASTETAH